MLLSFRCIEIKQTFFGLPKDPSSAVTLVNGKLVSLRTFVGYTMLLDDVLQAQNVSDAVG